MGCATTTVKISSIVFNVILALCSIVAIVWISFNPDSLREEVAIGAYIACSLIVFFAFLGCFAAIRESVCLTATCAVFLLLLAALQIALTCIGMSEGGARNAVGAVNGVWETKEMDKMQKDHECCGKISINDYIMLNKAIPASCYIDEDTTKDTNLFKEGCIDSLQKYYETESLRFAIVSWCLVSFEIIGFLLAVFFSDKLPQHPAAYAILKGLEFRKILYI